ncbi:MAG: endonuclease/exonuclease/phosphatase family protein [Acidobacteria bacterium]|nr:endonuclease/exonuclease/phosphatase family protein [Acidobacteriota bacterium]
MSLSIFSKSICRIFIPILLLVQFAAAQNLKLMTYNIRLDLASDRENDWNHRKDFLSGQLRFYGPDIFGVQEALPNQLTDLATALPEYARIGIGRDGEGKGEASAIFYNKSRFRVSGAQTFWLSETPEKVSKGWDASYIRICTFGLFEDLKTKRRFWVFNTHLDNDGVIARKKGVEMILARMKAVNRNNYPVILMGDFNSEPDSELLVDLRKVMTDARTASAQKPFGPAGTFNGFRYERPVTLLIDYIFVDDPKRIAIRKYAVLSESIDLRFASDHFPVFVEAEIVK